MANVSASLCARWELLSYHIASLSESIRLAFNLYSFTFAAQIASAAQDTICETILCLLPADIRETAVIFLRRWVCMLPIGDQLLERWALLGVSVVPAGTETVSIVGVAQKTFDTFETGRLAGCTFEWNLEADCFEVRHAWKPFTICGNNRRKRQDQSEMVVISIGLVGLAG
jgi:hypothetical protein